jgi:hypothetical protein
MHAPRAALSTSAALGLHDTRLGLTQDGSNDTHPTHGNGCMITVRDNCGGRVVYGSSKSCCATGSSQQR